MQIKVKTWIEDEKQNLIFGGGKTQILKYIDETGSILAASKILGMNYKKAWSHIKILQEYIEDELVIVQKGRNNGGTTLTPKAKEIIKNYQILQDEINIYAQERFDVIFLNKNAEISCKKDSHV
ncbi:MAG: molybdenum transporter [Arcobacter sp.]|nr:MAG: molybdenum transporter [Arcobacter sp.]